MSGLKPKQEKFLLALLQEDSISQASVSAGISRETGNRYYRDPVFKEVYRSLRREIMSQVTGRLQFVSMKAVRELENILDNPDASDYNKIQASQLILDKAYRGIEVEDVEERLERLENNR